MKEVRNERLGGLDVDVTLFGGQTFRWRRTGERTAEGWIGDRPVAVEVRDDALAAVPLDGRWEGLGDAVACYFDAERDYAAIERRLLRDARLRRIARGIRILKQPPFETAIAFIVSANNNIPRIARSVGLLCEIAGREVEARGRRLRAFPEPAALAALSAERLRRDANLGYRDVYVVETSRLVASGAVDLDAFDRLPTAALRQALVVLPGVGPKVADCIALFAYGRLEVFPVDTWIRRAYSEVYLGGEPAPDREIAERARQRFGPYAGLAQQYLFEAFRARR